MQSNTLLTLNPAHEQQPIELPEQFSLSAPERAYLAGLFDGEGCVLIKSSNFALTLSVSQAEPEDVLHHIKRSVGFGSIYELKYKKNPKFRKCFQWVCNAANAATFCEIIQPYSIVKKRQLDLAIRYWNWSKQHKRDKSVGRERWEFQQEMVRLKNRSCLNDPRRRNSLLSKPEGFVSTSQSHLLYQNSETTACETVE